MRDIKSYILESQSSEVIAIMNGDEDSWDVVHGFWDWLESNGINTTQVNKEQGKKLDRKFGEGEWDCIDGKDKDKFYKLIKKGVSGHKYSYNGKDWTISVKCDNINDDGAFVLVNGSKGYSAEITCKNFTV